MYILVLSNFDSKLSDQAMYEFCDEHLRKYVSDHFPDSCVIEYAVMADPGTPRVQLIFNRDLTDMNEIQSFAPALGEFVRRRVDDLGIEDEIEVATSYIQSL